MQNRRDVAHHVVVALHDEAPCRFAAPGMGLGCRTRQLLNQSTAAVA
jgi:hypothetical protein